MKVELKTGNVLIHSSGQKVVAVSFSDQIMNASAMIETGKLGLPGGCYYHEIVTLTDELLTLEQILQGIWALGWTDFTMPSGIQTIEVDLPNLKK